MNPYQAFWWLAFCLDVAREACEALFFLPAYDKVARTNLFGVKQDLNNASRLSDTDNERTTESIWFSSLSPVFVVAA
jgi:hypothetical protein